MKKEKKRKRKEKKRKEKKKKKKRKRRREKKKRKEREREENAGAARSAAGGQARGACPSRSSRHGQLPVIPIVQRPPGADVAGTASGPGRQ
jgi:outer membrane biosynthesis protein TonB